MPHRQDFNPRQYMLDNAFEVFHYTTPRGDIRPVSSHFHDYYEIYLFEAGDVVYAVGKKRYRLQPGDILLISPREPHYPVFGTDSGSYSRLVLWVSEQYIENAKLSCGCNLAQPFDSFSEHGTHLLRLPPSRRAALFETAEEMADTAPGVYARAENNIRLLSFLVELNRRYTSFSGNFCREESFSETVLAVIDTITNNLEKPLALDSLADQHYVSKYHLAHEFKRLMGLSVGSYITKKRLYRARQMLLGGAAPRRTATACGFHDYSAFYRRFVAEYGLSPRALAAQTAGTLPTPE